MGDTAAPEERGPDAGDKSYDWEAIEQWPEFTELTARKRSFVLPATIFFLTYYMVFVLLCGYAPDFMGKRLTGGLTVGYVIALTQFVMVAGLGLWYMRKADREFDPLAKAVIDRAESGDAAR